MKNKTMILGILLLIVAGLLFSYLIFEHSNKKEDNMEQTNVYECGNGDKTVTIEIVDNMGEVTTYLLHTNAKTLRKGMDELVSYKHFSYSGDESIFGIVVTEINGLQTEYDKRKDYWSFHMNGKQCEYSVDNQPLQDGQKYMICYAIFKE